jgi:type I restriction enzyme S subunit
MVAFPRISVSEFIAAGEAELKTGPFGTQLKASEYTEEGTPVINVRNIGMGSIKADKLEFISDATRDRLSSHVLRSGDIVFGRKGAVERHVFIRKEQDGWFQGSDCLRLRFNSARVVPLFASYFFITEEHQRWMMNQCSHGATMSSLNQDILERIDLPLPSLPEQQRIAGILSAYDELIENSQRRIQILETMARALYREWFVQFKFPGHEKVKIIDGVPEGWAVKTLGDLVQFKSGFAFKSKTFTAEGEHRIVTIKNVQDGSFSPEPVSRIDECPAKLPAYCVLKDGDILLSLTGNVGRVCLVYGGPFLLNQRVSKLAPVEDFDWALTYCVFRDSEMRNKLEMLSNGVAQQNLSPVLASKMEFVLPPRELRQQFATFAEPMVRRIVQLYCQIQNLRRTRDLLLPRLLSGQVDITK